MPAEISAIQTSIGPSVDICGNAVSQVQVDSWRAAGKNVILSFGGKL
jgi:hypothetical protein